MSDDAPAAVPADQLQPTGDPVPTGLTSDEARRRLEQIGPNAVADTAPHRFLALLRNFWAPVPWMLEAAILLQLVLGELAEAAIIAALLLFNAALGFFQESRAQAALAALKSKLSLIASARRDGAWTKLPAAALVPGDVVKLSLGAVVPADVRLVTGAILLDQSMLTGESAPVEAEAGSNAYAGALVRRGEAIGEVTATGPRTYSGRAAELVRVAHAESAEQRAVLGVVRNLAVLNGGVVVLLLAYAYAMAMPLADVIKLVLTAVLASIPVALPATFTLATALSAQALARRGVLPTRLSAVHELATMDVLCSDKTGTLTQNALQVSAVRAMPGFDEERVLMLAALASSEGGADPVDAAVRLAAARSATIEPPKLVKFVPFDPAAKMSEARAVDSGGDILRVAKGAFAAVAALVKTPSSATAAAEGLARQGQRVLAVAAGKPTAMELAGLIALSDPPRPDSAPLIAQLRSLGVRTVMVTGDAPLTASAIAGAVGLTGSVCPAGRVSATARLEDYAVYAGVFPEGKYRLVKALQRGGHTVGMCGDGANDAPALRQAEIGIAVSSATDVAKSAAGIVLTDRGLGGIVAAVNEGRSVFQRILTYTLNALVKKIEMVLFIAVGLLMTGHAVLSPMLMVLLLVTNDFLTMSLATDRAKPSPLPDTWRIGRVTVAAAVLGLCKLTFSSAVVAVGYYGIGLGTDALPTLAFITLAFGSQATVYVVRERGRMWRSRPGRWLVLSTLVDLAIAGTLAMGGGLIAPLPPQLVVAVLGAALVFAISLDCIKVPLLDRLKVA